MSIGYLCESEYYYNDDICDLSQYRLFVSPHMLIGGIGDLCQHSLSLSEYVTMMAKVNEVSIGCLCQHTCSLMA